MKDKRKKKVTIQTSVPPSLPPLFLPEHQAYAATNLGFLQNRTDEEDTDLLRWMCSVLWCASIREYLRESRVRRLGFEELRNPLLLID